MTQVKALSDRAREEKKPVLQQDKGEEQKLTCKSPEVQLHLLQVVHLVRLCSGGSENLTVGFPSVPQGRVRLDFGENSCSEREAGHWHSCPGHGGVPIAGDI